MKVDGTHWRTIWPLGAESPGGAGIIDQRELPHNFVTRELKSVSDYAVAIKDMAVRGAGLIGACAGYGMWAASLEAPDNRSDFDAAVHRSAEILKATRPTAVNLAWAVDRQVALMSAAPDVASARDSAACEAAGIADEDAAMCKDIGAHGLKVIQEIYEAKRRDSSGDVVVNILTHCNAGWLAFVDYGSATAPIYAAHDTGIPVHVWVSETRPRAQGAALTAWELGSHGVSHDIIVDGAGGHLMQHGMVDLVITGADRVSAGGDVANKIGTYHKALAAVDNHLPFYVALPSSTFDWSSDDGIKDIPIEERSADEVRFARGRSRLSGKIDEVLIGPEESSARNWAFDVTPRRLVTGLITERGICSASREGIAALYP